MIDKEDVLCGTRAWQRIYCAYLRRSESHKVLPKRELTSATQTATETGLQFYTRVLNIRNQLKNLGCLAYNNETVARRILID
eukprot:scaffold304677_cov34-Prasinocladus_malaysianus.AAC.1